MVKSENAAIFKIYKLFAFDVKVAWLRCSENLAGGTPKEDVRSLNFAGNAEKTTRKEHSSSLTGRRGRGILNVAITNPEDTKENVASASIP